VVAHKLTDCRVSIATIVQIASLAENLTRADQTRAMIRPVVLQQIVMNLSILTAVVLGLHSFISNLTAGGFGVEVRGSTNESSETHGRSRRPTNSSKATSTRQDATQPQYSRDHQSRIHELDSRLRADEATRNSVWAQHEESNEWEDSDGRSHSSQENIIMQTVTWQVSRHTAPSSQPIGKMGQTPPRGEPSEASARNFVTQ
jgi:hypothetical protein